MPFNYLVYSQLEVKHLFSILHLRELSMYSGQAIALDQTLYFGLKWKLNSHKAKRSSCISRDEKYSQVEEE